MYQTAGDGEYIEASSQELSDAPVDDKIAKKASRKTSTGVKRTTKKATKKLKVEEQIMNEGSSDLSEMEEINPVDEKPVGAEGDLRV